RPRPPFVARSSTARPSTRRSRSSPKALPCNRTSTHIGPIAPRWPPSSLGARSNRPASGCSRATGARATGPACRVGERAAEQRGQPRPLDSPDSIGAAFRERGYITDRSLSTAVFLALQLGRPLLLEGEAGVGKTELAKVLASSLGARLIRLQCYEG